MKGRGGTIGPCSYAYSWYYDQYERRRLPPARGDHRRRPAPPLDRRGESLDRGREPSPGHFGLGGGAALRGTRCLRSTLRVAGLRRLCEGSQPSLHQCARITLRSSRQGDLPGRALSIPTRSGEGEMAQSTKIPHLMRVVVKPGSKAEAKHQPKRREAVRKPSPEL